MSSANSFFPINRYKVHAARLARCNCYVYNGYMNTVLHVKLDKELKENAQEAAKALGLPLSTVVTAALRDFVRTRSVTISDTPKLKSEVEKELLELSKKAKAGKDLSPGFDNAEKALEWLKS